MHECIQYDVMKNIFFFFLFIFLWLTIFCENLINLAVILPEDGIHQFSLKHVLPGIYLAVESLKDRPDILPGWKMQVHPTNSQCSSTYGPLMAVKFKYDLNPHVFLGPVCEYAVAPVARFTQVWNIPVITAGAQSNAFTQKSDEYRLLTRINGTYKQIGHMVLQMLENFKWNIVGFLFHDNKGKRSLGRSHCYFSVEPIFRGMEEKTKVRPHYQSFDEDDSTINYNKLIQEVAQHSRIIILCASPETVYNILLAAESLKMIQSGDYVFINLDLFESKSKDFKPWHNKHHSKENNDRARVAYEALLTVTPRLPDSTEYANFSREVKKVAKEEFDFEYGNEQVNTYVTSFHEAVILYALALNDTLAAGYSADNGTHITKMMWNRTFIGITGNVSIDENGDRNADYSLLDMDPETGNFQVIANYYGATTQFINVPHKYIHWAGGRSDAPPDTPTCGFDGSGCSNNSFPEYAIVSLVMGILVCTLIIASVFIYRHYKLEAELSAMTWRIKWEDIMFGNLDKTKKIGSKLSLARNSLMSSHSTETFALQNGDKHVFAITAYYKAILVAIKKLSSSRVEITRQLLMDLKRMRDIQHDHIVRFIGACIDPPNCCIITEYCPKGSLQDILENDQIKLDWMFRYSLMHDIIKGLAYLHSSEIRTHGNLKSSNCVVDSRFVLKVTDFGLHYLRNSDEDETCSNFSYWKKKLWTAPELLNLSSSSQEGTQKGDVYSFAIIMQEIIYRNGPFYVESMDFSPEEITQKVKNKEKPSFRPTVTSEACDEELVKMVQRCWSDEPLDRPDFQTLKIVIRKLNIENESGNILDNLLSRMEQYASNLETLVHERTADYLEQKHKAEELLYQLLPKSVAEQLIRGEAVTAEAFDMVTIYFSDIVGFTALSAQSTPMQIVDFLNDLYICFDSIIEHFDVYKVETIGDAYMVVSGLPVRNDNFHANEIARMALALLKAVKKFKIRHRPAEQLKLRIGIHTGPCVAGVVGLKMPRYCLFGDTVNTASRMESNGLPLKIHVSPQTKEVLDQCKNFRLELRGEIEMKGKGKVTTYWLLGENSRFPTVNEITNEIPQAISMSTEVPQPEINKKQIRAVQIPDGLISENTSTILGNHV